MICLLQSFIESLTVVLPYYPVGTMERVTKEGTVATAATFAHMFSSLPSCGRPTRLMVYDLHTLQNRFYLVRYFLVAGYAYMYTNRTMILVFVPMRQYIATKLLWLLASTRLLYANMFFFVLTFISTATLLPHCKPPFHCSRNKSLHPILTVSPFQMMVLRNDFLLYSWIAMLKLLSVARPVGKATCVPLSFKMATSMANMLSL